jgi:type II secretory ATPase GspE/PulE/Tfp pilus assembly ATPase PilB-like protein
MGVQAFLISSSLEGVLAQSSLGEFAAVQGGVPSFCGVRVCVDTLGGRRIEGVSYRGTGCDECRGTGYRGQIGIFELLAIDTEVKELVLQKRSNAELKATAQKRMLTMHQDALHKAAAGITSLEEILRVSSGDLLE